MPGIIAHSPPNCSPIPIEDKIDSLRLLKDDALLQSTLKDLYLSYKQIPEQQKFLVDNVIWEVFARTHFYPQLDVTSAVMFELPRRRLGHGDYGAVYAAKCHGKDVAVKVLGGQANESRIREITGSPTRHMYFFREIKIWRSITPHVNVSPLIGYVYSADALELGLVSPLADTDLRRWAEAHQHFRDESTDRLRYALICDAAAGLIHLHNQVPPVIHGDLHARNVLISVAGQAMITDFGISKFGEAESTFSVESPDRPVLREAWLAPELIRNPRASRTMKSDLFALARTVLELFTARDPFHDQAPQNLTLHILQHGIPSRPDLISDEVWMLLQRCWAIDPRDRGTVNSFRADLSVHI